MPICKCADVTDPEVLRQLSIATVDIVIIAMANNLEASVMAVTLCKELGVKTEYSEHGARLIMDKNHQLSFVNCQLKKDFTHCPDIAQTMAVTYCLLGIPYTFSGIHSLRIKETDRVAALIAELRKLGYVLHAEGNERLIWDGTRCTPNAQPTISTYDDHRMAMAFAPAALCYEELSIEHPEVVTKSYPTFWEELNRIES